MSGAVGASPARDSDADELPPRLPLPRRGSRAERYTAHLDAIEAHVEALREEGCVDSGLLDIGVAVLALRAKEAP